MANLLEQLEAAKTYEDLKQWRISIRKGGYTAFSTFLQLLQEKMKQYGDDEAKTILRTIRKGKRTLPRPRRISPAWDGLWERLLATAQQKAEILQTVPVDKREGEWQILINNPYVMDKLTCHPGLNFYEAAYFYGLFRQDLKKNEFMRLQQVQNWSSTFGD
ncbi:MAG TPA: hypothetical protein VF260_00845 [Bacilli bacterium]